MSQPEISGQPIGDLSLRRFDWWVVLYVGVVLPLACIMLSPMALFDQPGWQDDSWESKFGSMILAKVSWPLYVGLFYSCLCMAGLLSGRAQLRHDWRIQFGVFTGVPISAVFGIIFPIAIGVNFVFYWFGCFVAGVVFYKGLRLLTKWLMYGRRFWGWRIGGSLAILGVIFISVSLLFTESFQAVLTIPVVVVAASLMCATVWCFSAYCYCSMLLVKHCNGLRFGLRSILAAVTWIVVLMASLRWSILKSYSIYSSLPTAPPEDCYVATAAARGHAVFVRSQRMVDASGNPRLVNAQLARLKAAELLVRTTLPSGHRNIRRVYDRFGPLLAKRMQNRFVADLCYALLWPAELAAWLLVRVVGGKQAIAKSTPHHLYGATTCASPCRSTRAGSLTRDEPIGE